MICEEEEIEFLNKILERLKGYACGKHILLEKMILNEQKRLRRRIKEADR